MRFGVIFGQITWYFGGIKLTLPFVAKNAPLHYTKTISKPYMDTTKDLLREITKGIQEKKGSGIVIADLQKVEGAICKYFVVCQGNSPLQVDAIANSVIDVVRDNLHEKPVGTIGLDNAQWVAMDYTDVIVHVMLPEMREYYSLETLWSDANLERLPDLN